MDIRGALTRSYAGIPGWLVALAGAAAVYLLFLRPSASGSAAGLGAAGPAGPAGAAGLAGAAGMTGEQGLQGPAGDIGATGASGAAGTQGPAGPAGTAAPASGFPDFTSWLQQAYGGSRPDLLAAINAGNWQALQGEYSKEAIAYAKAHGTGGAGIGGRGNSISSRAAQPHAYFHGSMKALPRYAHFTRSAGVGGAGHSEAVHATAHVAGLHPARLAMLNPRPHKFLRVA